MVEGSGVKVEMPDEAESSVTLRVLLVEDDLQQMALSGIIARAEAENAQLTVQLKIAGTGDEARGARGRREPPRPPRLQAARRRRRHAPPRHRERAGPLGATQALGGGARGADAALPARPGRRFVPRQAGAGGHGGGALHHGAAATCASGAVGAAGSDADGRGRGGVGGDARQAAFRAASWRRRKRPASSRSSRRARRPDPAPSARTSRRRLR